MPNILDERIVAMRFDNAQFEKGVQTSLNTLDKLENDLKYVSDPKSFSFDKLSSAVQHFDLSKIGSAVDKIQDRFTLFGRIGANVLQGIADKATGALMKIPNALQGPLNQIKTGGVSRALNLEQARFMLKGLTGDMQKVAEIIDGPVNNAVSGTRFGLDAAAVAASNLYASGITDSKELEKSLQAVSGAATMTNREYSEMADIFSTIKSNGKLMTMQLRQFSAMGMNVSAELATALGKSEQEINDMVTKGAISYDQFVDVMYKYWDLAADANSTYSGSLANVNAQLSKLGEVVATKYFTSMINVNTALINLLKAIKGELGPAYEIINNVIGKVTDKLAAFISDAKTLKTVSNIIKGLVNVMQGLEPVVSAIGDTVKKLMPADATKNLLQMSKAFKSYTKEFRLFMGVGDESKRISKTIALRKEDSKHLHKILKYYNELKTASINKDELGFLTKKLKLSKEELLSNESAISTYKDETQALRDTLNANKSKSKSIHKIIEAYDSLNGAGGKYVTLSEKEQRFIKKTLGLKDDEGDAITEALEKYDKENAQLEERLKLRDKDAKQLNDILKRYKLEQKAKKDGIKISEEDQKFLEKTLGIDAKHLKTLDKKVEAYDKTTKALKKQNEEIAKTATGDGMDKVRSILDGLYELIMVKGAKTIANFKGMAIDLKDIFQNIAVFAGNILVILSPLGRVIGGFVEAISTIGKAISEALLELSNGILLGFFDSLGVGGDKVQAIKDALDGLLPTTDAIIQWGNTVADKIKAIAPPAKEVADAIRALKDLIVETAKGNFNVDLIKRIFGKDEAIKKPKSKLMVYVEAQIEQLKQLLGFSKKAKTATAQVTKGVKQVKQVMNPLTKYVKQAKDYMDKFKKSFHDMFGNKKQYIDIQINLNRVFDLVSKLIGAITTTSLLKTLTNSGKDFKSLIGTFKSAINGITGNIKKVGNAITKTLDTLTKRVQIQMVQEIAKALVMLAGSAVALSLVNPKKLAAAMGAITVALIDLIGGIKALNKMDKDMPLDNSLEKTVGAVKELAKAILIMSVAILIAVKAIDDIKKMMDEGENGLEHTVVSVIIIEGLLWSMFGLMAAMKKIGSQSISKSDTAMVLLMIVTLRLLISSLKAIRKMIKSPADIGYMAVAFGFLEGLMWSMFGLMAAMKAIGKAGVSKGDTLMLNVYIKTVLELVGALSVLKMQLKSPADIGYMAVAFGFLEGLMWSMFGLMAAMKAIGKAGVSKGDTAMLALYIKAVLDLVLALTVIRQQIKSPADIGYMAVAFGFLEGLMWSMFGLMAAMKAIGKAGVSKGDAAMLVIAILAINALTKMLVSIKKNINSVGDIGYMVAAFVILEGLMWSMFGLMAALKTLNGGMKGVDIGSIVLLSTAMTSIKALITAMISIKDAIGNDLSGLAAMGLAFVALEAVMWSMVGVIKVMTIMSKGTEMKNASQSIALLITISNAMRIMVDNVGKLTETIYYYGIGESITAFLMLEVMMITLAGVIAVFAKIGANPQTVKSIALMSISCLAIAVAIRLIAPAIKTMAKIGPDAIYAAGAIVIFLGAFVGLGAIVGSFPQIAAGMMAISAAIAIFSAAIAILAVGLGFLLTSIAGFAAAIVALAKVSDTTLENGAKKLLFLLDTMKNVFVSLAELAVTFVVTFVKSLAKMYPQVIDSFLKMFEDTLKAISKRLPKIIKLGAKIVLSLLKGIAENIQEVVATGVKIAAEFLRGVAQNLGEIVDAGWKLVISFIDGMADAIDNNGDDLKRACLHLVKSIVGFIIGKENADKLFKAAKKLIKQFIKGVKGWWKDTKQAISDFWDRLVEFWNKYTDIETWEQMAVDLITGFINGINNMASDAISAIKDFGSNVVDGLKSVLGIASPSKVFYKLAVFTVEGFLNGLDDTTKKGRNKLNAFYKRLVPKLNIEFNNANLMNYVISLGQYERQLEKLDTTRKKSKKTIDAINKSLLEHYATRESENKKLSIAQQTELGYLQQKLQIEGELSNKEMLRLGNLLGLSKAEMLVLKDMIAKRKEEIAIVKKTSGEYKNLKRMVDQYQKEIQNRTITVNAYIRQNMAIVSEAVESFAKELYRETDEYKQNTEAIKENKKAIEDNMSAIEAEKKEKKDHIKVVEDEQQSLKDILLSKKKDNNLTEITNRLKKEGSKLSKKEKKQLEEKKKKLEEEQKEIKELQKELKKKGKLDDEQYIKLAKLLGLTQDEMVIVRGKIEMISKEREAISECTSDIENLTDANNDLKNSNDELADAIENGPAAKLAEFRDGIKDTITNALDPLQVALADSIDLFSKFSTTSVDFDLPIKVEEISEEQMAENEQKKSLIESLINKAGIKFNPAIIEKLKEENIQTLEKYLMMSDEEVRAVNSQISDTLISNLASFGNTYNEWKENMAELEKRTLSDVLLNRIKEVGPAGLDLVKQYLAMTDDEIKKANTAILGSTHATLDQWLTQLEDNASKQKKFFDDLNTLLANGLSKEAYNAFLQQGADAAGGYVEGLLNGSSSDISRVNEAYKTFKNLPEQLSGRAVIGAAAAGQDAGDALRESFLAQFTDTLMSDEELESMTKTMKDFVVKVTETAYIQASTESETVVDNEGEDVGETFATATASGIKENSYKVTSKAKSMGKNAKEGVNTYLSKANGKEIGEYLDEGLVAGIYKYEDRVVAAARSVAKEAFDAAVSELQIESPSKKFAWIGKMTDLGFAKGISDYSDRVRKASEALSEGSFDTLRDSLMELSESLSDEANAPVIKPILDLSNVSAGAASLRHMMEDANIGVNTYGNAADEVSGSGSTSGNTYSFVQNNYSPKELSRIDIYRQTKNQFAMLKGVTR